jgi:hypothetical protein
VWIVGQLIIFSSQLLFMFIFPIAEVYPYTNKPKIIKCR